MLENKSIHQLRGIAQSFGITDIFSKTDIQLRQEISLKQEALSPAKLEAPPKPEYDARLMTKPPSKQSDRELALEVLKPYIDKGLHVDFPNEEEWHMRWGKREDTGTLRMPLRVILQCAAGVMK